MKLVCEVKMIKYIIREMTKSTAINCNKTNTKQEEECHFVTVLHCHFGLIPPFITLGCIRSSADFLAEGVKQH